MPGQPKREVFIEIIQMGGSVKVSAIDPDTGTEVSIVGPPSAGEELLTRNAVNKLNYMLAKRRGDSDSGDDDGGWRA
ncbi:MAG: hypothetical protein V3R85_00870 [Alphaproteobacteria bacterium]